MQHPAACPYVSRTNQKGLPYIDWYRFSYNYFFGRFAPYLERP